MQVAIMCEEAADLPSLPQVVTAAAKWSPGALLVTAAGAAPASAPAAAAEAPTNVSPPGATPVLRGWGDLTRADGGERPLGALLTRVQCQSWAPVRAAGE